MLYIYMFISGFNNNNIFVHIRFISLVYTHTSPGHAWRWSEAENSCAPTVRCFGDTTLMATRNPARKPEVGSLSHYLRRVVVHPRWLAGFQPSTGFFDGAFIWLTSWNNLIIVNHGKCCINLVHDLCVSTVCCFQEVFQSGRNIW